MKLPIYDEEKKKLKEKELPIQFNEEYRPDLIWRAVLALQSNSRQAYGADPEAGWRHSSEVSKRRKNYRGCYGFGISRVRRKILSRRGTRMFWVGTSTPQTRGGHRAHPPKAEKILGQKINQKENCKAIRSALAATLNKNIVEHRGHKIPLEYPFLIESSFENLKKTLEVEKILLALGFNDDLERCSQKKIRAGTGKSRGRKYRRKKGLLIVVSTECPLIKAAGNIPGIEIVPVRALNAEVLAPGAKPGRITLWTEKAIETIEQEKLFMNQKNEASHPKN